MSSPLVPRDLSSISTSQYKNEISDGYGTSKANRNEFNGVIKGFGEIGELRGLTGSRSRGSSTSSPSEEAVVANNLAGMIALNRRVK